MNTRPRPSDVNPEKQFWQLAGLTAASSWDPLVSLGLLLKQFRAVRPRATPAETAAAEGRLRTLLKLPAA